MILKLGMKHQAIELYKICIKYDPWMTLTYFTAMSTYKSSMHLYGEFFLQYDLMGKTCRKWANRIQPLSLEFAI